MKITPITKTADSKAVPGPQILSDYVETLKNYERDNPSYINPILAKLIRKLPYPDKVRKEYSYEECKVLYETVQHVWGKISGGNIIEEREMKEAPETLEGNYWMLRNGILLHGVNHYGIIKQNPTIFSSILKVNGFALQQYLIKKPNELINFIIRNGGVRVFVTKDKRAFFQMSEDTYAKWGKEKVKKMDFRYRVIRVLDPEREYTGWNSGVAVRVTGLGLKTD
jgi:hypothetical protein